MRKINQHLKQASEADLARVIEPLADYICATDQPNAVLKSALTFLFRTVEELNAVAGTHLDCGCRLKTA